MTSSDLDLEGISPKVAKWVPLSKSNIHAKFGMDRASSFDATNLPENFNQKSYADADGDADGDADAQVSTIARPILRIVELKMLYMLRLLLSSHLHW